MVQPKRRKRGPQDAKLEDLFERASRKWDEGEVIAAFRLFLAAAKLGDTSSQINLGYFYAHGIGVKANRELALYWYRRAYRRGERCAANNIGVVFRDEQKLKQALKWFERAVSLGDGDANLEIAKIYLCAKERDKATHFLKETLKADPDDVTEGSLEEAERLLKELGLAGEPSGPTGRAGERGPHRSGKTARHNRSG
jgi:TPR repeat protein